MNTQILVPSAPILVESTRSIGYSFETAVADIIDNSISKHANNIFIYFDSNNPQYLMVLDNGAGMDNNELIDAMKYGSKSSNDERDKDDLGRFGLGLKMASLSQCRKLTVVSKKGSKLSGAVWDLDHIIETNNWELILLDDNDIKQVKYIDKLNSYESGTIVLWENFDRITKEAGDHSKIFDNKITITRAHVSLVFHRFLSESNKISIFFNNELVQPTDPFFSSHQATQKLEEETKIINGNIIKIRPYILPYISKLNTEERQEIFGKDGIKLNQGFYVYRNKRLIIWGTWFRMTAYHELKQLTRIRIDIPNTMDSLWEIDIKKSTASLPESIKKELKTIVEKSIFKSERVYTYRGRELNNNNIAHIWNIIEERDKKIKYCINKEHNLYKSIFKHLDDEGKELFGTFIESVENFFPYKDVYARLSKQQDCIETDSIEDDKIYRACRSYMDMLFVNEKIEFLNNLEKNELIMNRKDIINKLKEDFENE